MSLTVLGPLGADALVRFQWGVGTIDDRPAELAPPRGDPRGPIYATTPLTARGSPWSPPTPRATLATEGAVQLPSSMT